MTSQAKYVILSVFLSLSVLLCAQELDSGTDQADELFVVTPSLINEADTYGLYWGAGMLLEYKSEFFRITGDLSFVNDGKWFPSESWMKDGYYFNLREASIKLLLDPFALSAGFLPVQQGYSANPYEILFDSSGKRKIGATFKYEGDTFVYQSSWIALNYLSNYVYNYGMPGDGFFNEPWKDRGLNYKMFLFKFGRFRVGYEETSLYLERVFDANYFLNPAPSIFINTLWSNQSGNPWVLRTNDSSLMGVYGDYRDDRLYAEAEFVIKDLNLPFGYTTNLNKFAWSLGGILKTGAGDFSFWSAGATKHMFAATYQSESNPNIYPYEYTYYPQDIVSGKTLSVEENSIGFPYGENSLAFEFEWENEYQLDNILLFIDAGMEWVINGSKSPHNPWHEYIDCSEISNKTELFYGDNVLENRFSIRTKSRLEFGDFFISAEFSYRLTVNALALEGNEDIISRNEHSIWKPQEGLVTNAFALRFVFGYSFRFGS